MSSSPTRVTMKMPLARKATGNHLVNYASLEKAQGSVSGFCYSRNRVCDAVLIVKNCGRTGAVNLLFKYTILFGAFMGQNV